MSKGPCTFRKSDFRRAIQAAESAGMKVGRIEVDKSGKIVLFPSDDAASVAAVNEWDAAQNDAD
jgi:hypothetical protein